MNINQLLIHIHHLDRSPNAEVLFRCLNHVLCLQYRFRLENILGSMQDRASVNGAALNLLHPLLENHLQIPCMAHTLNSAGELFNSPLVSSAITYFVTITSKSSNACKYWNELVEKQPQTSSSTRWWSYLDVVIATLEWNFNQYKQFMEHHSHLESAKKALKLIEEKERILCYEICAYIHIGRQIKAITYFLESDTFLMPFVHDKLILVSEILQQASQGSNCFHFIFAERLRILWST